MKSLQRELSNIFRVTQRDKMLQSVQLADARDMKTAKRLADLYGITLEREREGYWVTCKSFTDGTDPLEGNHFCTSGREVLEAVQVYIDHRDTQPTIKGTDHA